MTKKPIRRWLTPEEKAEIVISREARPITHKTNKDIADDMGVSEYTVLHTNRDNLSTEAREIYDDRKSKLAELALDVTTEALLKGQELIASADSPKALSGIASVGKFADSVYRLETRQPTDIRSVSSESHALEFLRLLLSRTGSLDAALEYFSKSSLEPLVTDVKRDEVIRRVRSGLLVIGD